MIESVFGLAVRVTTTSLLTTGVKVVLRVVDPSLTTYKHATPADDRNPQVSPAFTISCNVLLPYQGVMMLRTRNFLVRVVIFKVPVP